MSKKNHSLLIIILAFFLASCGYSKEEHAKEQAFLALYPEVLMNQKLKIRLVKVPQPPRLGDDVELVIENKSTDAFQIPYENVAIWEYDSENDEWTKITNGIKYLSDGPITVSSDPDQMKILTVYPKVLDDLSHKFRILVYGNVIRGETVTDEMDGAFIDISLEP